ncbi:glycosyltransferase, partial [Mycobacterium avium]
LREPQPGDPPYVAVPYLDRMDLAYAAADLVICRSGAMTVAEVSAVGLPAIYVPLPIGNGEQRLNALPVVDAGGGMVVADADLTPELVAREVAGLVGDPPR